MAASIRDEEYLLTVLNSTPVVGGIPVDRFADTAATRTWLADAGGTGTETELQRVREVRSLLQAVVRGHRAPTTLAPHLEGVARIPSISDGSVSWMLRVPPEREMAVRAILIWDELTRHGTGRLRPCANPDCRRFLIDHSKANSARWCSMAVCGNRMKARRHYQRVRDDTDR